MKGFTLIEILIAVSIIIVVATIIVTSIVLGGRIYDDGKEKIELIQNGRVVLDAISREVRQAEKITTTLPDNKSEAKNKIVFEDGHLKDVKEEGNIQGGSSRTITLPSESSSEDGFYKNMYIKIVGGSTDLEGETRKIVDYNGDTKEAQIEFPFNKDDYFGLEYVIDTSFYYVEYYLKDNKVRRKVSAYYFSEDPSTYVPVNSTPPDEQIIEEDIFEDRVIGEHFNSLSFWEDQGINIFTELKLNNKEIDLRKKVSGRNL